MTVVEGEISKARTKDFLSRYASVGAQSKPPGWKRSMLLHDPDEEGLYRISTLWDSREALEQMRKNTKVPFAVQIFRTHGAQPNVRIFEVPLPSKPNENRGISIVSIGRAFQRGTT